MNPSGNLITIQENNDLTPGNLIDGLIAAWLDAKWHRSGSTKTLNAYRDSIADFRATLSSVGIDLDGDPQRVALTAQKWAGSSKVGREIAASTFNQRIAILNSFYQYGQRQGILTTNPIMRVDNRKVEQYGSAVPLDAINVKDLLAKIDRSTLAGQRDYVLLAVALTTGRRLSELASLRWKNLNKVGEQVTLTFHAKGGKSMADKLTPVLTKALYTYLMAVYGGTLGSSADDPVWVSLSNRTNRKPLSTQAIADICQKRLGVSKVHALRHTFAHSMQDKGAPVSEIQARLGHASLQTTGRYLASLNKANNPYANELSEMFGLSTPPAYDPISPDQVEIAEPSEQDEPMDAPTNPSTKATTKP